MNTATAKAKKSSKPTRPMEETIKELKEFLEQSNGAYDKFDELATKMKCSQKFGQPLPGDTTMQWSGEITLLTTSLRGKLEPLLEELTT